MKTLIVYYSRSGHTEKAALELAKELGADVVGLRENQPRNGLFGFIRSGREAMGRKLVQLRPLGRNVELFDRVIVATPVWAGRLSSPMRSFLVDNSAKIREVGVMLSHGDGKRSYGTVVQDIESIVGKKSVFEKHIIA